MGSKEVYTVGLVGVLTSDSYLKLDGGSLVNTILDYMPSTPILGEYNFGTVKIEITFNDYNSCPHCGSIVKKEGR